MHMLLQSVTAYCLNGDPERKDRGQNSQRGRMKNEKQEA